MTILKITVVVFAAIIFITGLLEIIIYTNWQTAFGIFLLIWANNVSEIFNKDGP